MLLQRIITASILVPLMVLAVFKLPADPGADFGALFDALLATQRCALTVCGGKVIHGSLRDVVAA